MEIRLIRNLRTELPNDKNAIEGRLLIMDKTIKVFKTLENILYLCPQGKYLLKYEYSPKFKTGLWELYGTNKRTEIKIHHGTHSKHSKGCILLRDNFIDELHDTLHSGETYTIIIN